MNKHRLLTCVTAIVFIFSQSCVDPVSPGFEYREGLVYIDALAASSPGASYVNIWETTNDFGIDGNKFVSGASVFFMNTATAQTISLTESDESYVTPEDFVVVPGETWELRVILSNGTEYYSEPETVLNPVPTDAMKVTYHSELLYSGEFEGFIPGHRLYIDLHDPAGEENFYYWRFRSFEKLSICKICYNSINRGGDCIAWNNGPPLMPYYVYYCEPECWRIRYAEEISIYSDRFTNGKNIQSLPVATVPLHTRENIVVELQQFSVSEAAHSYLKTLKDLIDNNSGLNAPLPAALIGNLYNPTNREEFVLGRFTAAATSVTPVYIERMLIPEEPLDMEVYPVVEGPEAPDFHVFTATCSEGRFRTAVKPPYWPDS
jgi:hypothetical protein